MSLDPINWPGRKNRVQFSKTGGYSGYTGYNLINQYLKPIFLVTTYKKGGYKWLQNTIFSG
jgi:hypothetical protein